MAFPSLKLDIPKHDGDGEVEGEYYLASFQENDVEAMYQVLRLKDVGGWLISLPRPYTIDHAKSWIRRHMDFAEDLAGIESPEERRKVFWDGDNGGSVPVQVIRYKSRDDENGEGGGKLVGCVSLMRMGKFRFGVEKGKDGVRGDEEGKGRKEKVVEMGYYIHPDHRGRGIMVSAAITAVKYARDVWDLRWVYVEVDRENWASWRTRERIFEGTRRWGNGDRIGVRDGHGDGDGDGDGDGVIEAETKMEVGTVGLVWPEGTTFGGHDGVRESEWWCWRV